MKLYICVASAVWQTLALFSIIVVRPEFSGWLLAGMVAMAFGIPAAIVNAIEQYRK